MASTCLMLYPKFSCWLLEKKTDFSFSQQTLFKLSFGSNLIDRSDTIRITYLSFVSRIAEHFLYMP